MTRRLLLFGLLLLLSVVMLSGNAYAWLSGWDYRRPITIENSGSTELTDFQVKVVVDTATLISEGKMNSDCSDMRFTDDSDTELPYWIEGPCNDSQTVVWVKVPSIPANGSTTIYMYYGNPSATSQSDGESVFLAFSGDYEGKTVSEAVGTWDTLGTITDYMSVSGDELRIYNAENGGYPFGALIMPSSVSSVSDAVVEMRVRAGAGSDVYGLTVVANDAKTYDSDGSHSHWRAAGFVTNYSNYTYQVRTYSPPGTETARSSQSSVSFTTSYSTVMFRVTPSSASFIVDGSTINTANGDVADGDTWYSLEFADSGSTSLKCDYYFTWIRVRKFTDPEPTASVGAEETSGVGVSVSLSHSPTAAEDLALDPEAEVTSITVEYNAVVSKNNVTVTYYRAYDGDSNTTLVEGTDDVNYITFSRTYDAVGDYNTCVYVRAVDDQNNEYDDTTCNVVHIDEYPQGLDFDWNNHIPFPNEDIEFTGAATDNGTLTYSFFTSDHVFYTGNKDYTFTQTTYQTGIVTFTNTLEKTIIIKSITAYAYDNNPTFTIKCGGEVKFQQAISSTTTFSDLNILCRAGESIEITGEGRQVSNGNILNDIMVDDVAATVYLPFVALTAEVYDQTLDGNPVTARFWEAGTYTVTMTVTDDVGLSKSVSKSVAVYAEPELNWTPATPHAQEPTTFTIQYDDRLSISGTEWNIPDSVTSYWYDTQSTAAFQHYGVHTVSVSTTLSDGTEFRDVSISADVNVIPIHIALRVKDEETLQDFNVDHLGNNPSIDVDLYTQDGEYYSRTITETGQTVSWDLNSLVDHITVRYSIQGQPVFRQYYFRQPYYDLDFNAYMPDATVSQTLQMTFTIEDQTGQFDDPLLIIERYSDDQTIEVLSAKKDAEGKIVAYLISGAEYTLSVWQDGVEKSLGVYIPITAQSVTLQIGGFVIRPSTPAGQCVTWSVDVDTDTNTLTVDMNSCETITAVVHVYDSGQEIYQTTLTDITTGEAKYTGVDPDKDYLVVVDVYVGGTLANTLKTWVSGSRTLALGWPSYYYELVAAAIILISLLFSGAAFGWFGGLMAILLAALFTYWGWIHVPYLLLALLGAIVLFGRRVS